MTTHPPSGSMPNSDELSAWIQAVAARQDRQAFAAVFKHFAPRVKAYLMRLGSPEGLAEDLAQETMVSVWRKAALYDARHAGVSTWIFTIARNLRVDQLRRKSHTIVAEAGDCETEPLQDTAPQPDEQLSIQERELRVREAMRQLSQDQAHILRLSFFEEHPHARIAEELGIPLGTVKSRVRLAVNHLRRLLGALEP
ncbi:MULTISPECIES: sigma-70 family RNA polymerase sigma factor [unclassified Acidovorax]|uniref:sigma-70 family RNA polymerase sigma factor n=2 Tax=unclassified Acidovorax TaxID=2684926 RepID=UPI002882EE55|nr:MULTISPECIES: sigma-70 family RNA polymerase sigma factor [unclassified Acidovorax]